MMRWLLVLSVVCVSTATVADAQEAPASEEQRLRAENEHLAAGLRSLSWDELRARRQSIVLDLLGSGLMTGFGAASVVGGFVSLQTGCTSLFSGECEAPLMAAGLSVGIVGALSLIIGAIWLAESNRSRHRLDAAIALVTESLATAQAAEHPPEETDPSAPLAAETSVLSADQSIALAREHLAARELEEAEHVLEQARERFPDSAALTHLLRLTRRRASRERFVGDLRLLNRAELNRRREGNDPQVGIAALMVGLGASGVLFGAIGGLASWEGPTVGGSSSSGDFPVIAGGVAAAAGPVLIIGAIWLGIVDRDRRRLNRALELTSVSLVPTEGGAVFEVGARY